MQRDQESCQGRRRSGQHGVRVGSSRKIGHRPGRCGRRRRRGAPPPQLLAAADDPYLVSHLLFVGFSSYYATGRKWDGAVIPQLAVYHFLFIKLQNQSATIFMFFAQGADGSRGRGLHGCAVLQEGAEGRR
ncbi:hypothetical protein ZEAMMB73_Zm00001d005944 [Zea mays]|uniref:Uncharacterized protein n=1 Tax=Zea mays TaxID=4577 RepID=A0A1D6ERN2_MAIZE|nr:hypothetical protein ZEAMMB73_Zm00001d005944 [Zea mays]